MSHDELTEDKPIEDKLIEKAARAIQREYLHTDSLPDVSDKEFEKDFKKHREQYVRMAHACAKILMAEDLRYWAPYTAPGKPH